MLIGSPRTLAAVLAGVFLLTALAPTVVGDHAYSHRYIVFGRVLDEAGNPIADTQVEVGVDPGLQGKIESLCDPRQNADSSTDAWEQTVTRTTTNEYGEYTYCFHMHTLPRASDGKFRAKALGTEVAGDADTTYRRTIVNFVVPGTNGTESDAFDSTYLVTGRLMYTSSQKTVEQVHVYGDTFKNEPVKVTFRPASGEPVTVDATTNGYGDFAVRLPVAVDAGAGDIVVEANGETFTQTADTEFRYTDFQVKLQDPELVKNALFRFGPLVVLAGVLGVGAWFVLGGTAPKSGGPRKKAKR